MKYTACSRAIKRTSVSSNNDSNPMDLAQRTFHAEQPNQFWVADFTYGATWRGFFFMAFIIDDCSRIIVGWRVMKTMTTAMTLDAVEYATLDWVSRFYNKRLDEFSSYCWTHIKQALRQTQRDLE